MENKRSLKTKLFSVILIILMLNIILLLALGSTFFDKLYTHDKINSLKKSVDKIKYDYNYGSNVSLFQKIIESEQENITVCIFSLTGNTGTIDYYSRQYDKTRPVKVDIYSLIQNLYNIKAFDKLNEKTSYFILNDQRNAIDNNITILANLSDNNYIILQTPIPFIKELSDLAIKYTVYISIFTFIIVAVIVYFIADKATKPIREMQKVADKISNFDFSDRCNILTNDEIGLLSDSINNMSQKLQDFILQLMISNEKLKDDLTRQEKTDKMRRQFIANVSHDFKTPLTLIMSYSEALLDIKDINDNTKDEYLNIIINEGNKMSEFVQQLLKLSQLESGMLKLEKTCFSISEIIIDIINKNKIMAEAKNVKTIKDVNESNIVYADYFKIEHVIQNLYENAIKYTTVSGIVKISTHIVENKCLISIYNTGNHISDEDIENIFISFYRSDKSRKNMGSYGLGLAIVKVTMDMHGEKYGVSNKDGGVEFWIELENVEMED